VWFSVLVLFSQVLLQLCRRPVNVEKLVETQELQCLIIGLTSLWDQTSAPWRHQASRVLKAVSAVATSNTVPSFIHADVSGSLLAEVAVAVFSFIRDTYSLNPALFLEFDTHGDGRTESEQDSSFSVWNSFYHRLDLSKLVPPCSSGFAVKNLQAYRLLQASLLRSQDCLLCCQLLRTIQTIWERDPANFFLLEWTVQSMAQVAACVWSKPVPVQKLFFSQVEMVVYKMTYIPHETLHALVLCPVCFAPCGPNSTPGHCRLTMHSAMLAEVFSDSGLLEMLLTELRRRAKIIRKTGEPQQLPCVEDTDRLLTTCMLEVVATLTLRSIKNTVSVRDFGMVPYIKIFLDEGQYRGPTLSILEQLAEVNPEEFMSTAIGAICSSTQQELGLKRDLLQSVSKVLDNPNSWDAFRRAGGFTGLLSVVIDMEGALSDPPAGDVWRTFEHQQLLDLLLLNVNVMTLAVHLHSVNAHHFETGGFYERLADALLQLGCFHAKSPEKEMWDGEHSFSPKTPVDSCSDEKSFHQFGEWAEASDSPSSSTPEPSLPVSLRTCIKLLSFLDRFAAGVFPLLNLRSDHESGSQSTVDTQTRSTVSPYRTFHPNFLPLCFVCHLTHSRLTCDHVILHPGAIRVIMTLLPAVFTPDDPQLSMEVQLSLGSHVQALVKPERNRQIMCEGGLLPTLLGHCQHMLLNPNHPLHLSVTRILEKLSSQAITHSDFRSDFTLSYSPDKCRISSGKKTKRNYSLLPSSDGSPIPVHQIISLVSMTSPRTFRPHRLSTSPAFVEFDMSESGYGCLFLPTLATVKGVTADSISTGGIGGDCRGFPPTAGLSFSCWFQINRFSSACDSHPIRLLSVVRHMSRTEQQYICLSISFSAYDGCLVISTEEEAFTYLDMMEPEICTPTSLPASLRLRCSSMLVPGQWHHLTVVMAKDVKKSCLTSAYFNGKLFGTGKMRYIQPFPGQYVSMEPTALVDVFGLIGTPFLWKERAALVWRVGPCYLFEEALSPEAVGLIYSQGTTYLGNFLDLWESVPQRLVPEERISFGINPSISTLTTVVQIRDDYNEVDCRLIAKEMEITSRDNSTPVFLARNISQHLSGTARTIGAALIGHFGVRTFTPSSASNGFLYVGGPALVLGLVAMAPDDSSLYAAVKVLLSVLETNSVMQEEMNRIDGYKMLAFLLKMKRKLISNRTVQLHISVMSVFRLRKCCVSVVALCLQVWKDTSDNLDLSVLNHFTEILKTSSSGSMNAALMHSIGLIPKLLYKLSDCMSAHGKVKTISCVITSLLKIHFTTLDLSRLGLFMVYTLPPPSNRSEAMEVSDDDLSEEQKQAFDSLGSDWLLLFLLPHLHPSTVKLSLVLLTSCLSNQEQQSSFREAVIPATLIDSMEEPIGMMGKSTSGTDASWLLQLPASVMQFLCLLHSLRPRDPLWASQEFLHTLAGVCASIQMYSNGEDTVKSFQTRKPVCDFIRILLMDSLLNLPSNSSSCPLVQLLEVKKTPKQDKKTYMMQSGDGALSMLMDNVVVFGKTMLQKLYGGTFLADPEVLLNFLADQIVVVRQQHRNRNTYRINI
uniref:DUF4704 domain-containing protein n=1 Tax=Cynoglossus semilaevis TaxID=244447 RepID=A0A3P8VEH3_CYNSE